MYVKDTSYGFPATDKAERLLVDLWHYNCVIGPRRSRENLLKIHAVKNSQKSRIAGRDKIEEKTFGASVSKRREVEHLKNSTLCNGILPSQCRASTEGLLKKKEGGSISFKNWTSISNDSSSSNKGFTSGLSRSSTTFDKEVGTSLSTKIQINRSSGLSRSSTTYDEEVDGSAVQINRFTYIDRNLLAKIFDVFDENGDGKVSKEELCGVLEKLGFEADAKLVLSSITVKAEGYADIEEFKQLCGAVGSCGEEDVDGEERDLLEAFGVFDKDKDGNISAGELQTVLRSLGLAESQRIEDCEEMIRRADRDGDGLVNFNDFKMMMMMKNSLPSP